MPGRLSFSTRPNFEACFLLFNAFDPPRLGPPLLHRRSQARHFVSKYPSAYQPSLPPAQPNPPYPHFSPPFTGRTQWTQPDAWGDDTYAYPAPAPAIPQPTAFTPASVRTPAVSIYPESSQRTVLPQPTQPCEEACDDIYISRTQQSSPSSYGLQTPPQEIIYAAAWPESISDVPLASPKRSRVVEGPIVATTFDDYPPSPLVPQLQTAALIASTRGAEYRPHTRQPATHSGAARAIRQNLGVFHVEPFSSSPRPSSAEPLAPAVQAFRLKNSSLEPLEESEDPFPLCMDDLTRAEGEACYVGHSHEFYAFGDPAASQGGQPSNLPTESAVLEMSWSPAPSTSSIDSRASSTSSPLTMTPIASRGPNASSEMDSARRLKTKTHRCKICDKVFPRPSGLATHMNSHSGAKPFKCPVDECTKSFTVRSNAKRHLRTHGIDPPLTRRRPRDGDEIGFEEPVVSDVRCPTTFRAIDLKWVGQDGAETKGQGQGTTKQRGEGGPGAGGVEEFEEAGLTSYEWDPGDEGHRSAQVRIYSLNDWAIRELAANTGF
ncbi:hypothetical protein EW146_g1863 [Bondarzewia mesenterica]|uniref:C2H2-type domain-containing protein n=1 Tax=Bondarzewia mesenterica TaxID=1095465 RepID=A0A4S4M2L3_9AGAM|nr:hypothetical protein EW146_g1863 [Bondarzewia mesenterica]